jgi:hypothetical protein
LLKNLTKICKDTQDDKNPKEEQKVDLRPGMVACASNLSTWEAETGE